MKQIEFEWWANKEILASLKKASPLDDRALLLFSHNLSAANMWLTRLKGEPLNTTLFQERSLGECEALMESNAAQWKAYLQTAGDEEWQRKIDFIFPIDGSRRRIAVADAIIHILYHAAYHRGQIVLKLKGAVEALPVTGYVIFSGEILE